MSPQVGQGCLGTTTELRLLGGRGLEESLIIGGRLAYPDLPTKAAALNNLMQSLLGARY